MSLQSTYLSGCEPSVKLLWPVIQVPKVGIAAALREYNPKLAWDSRLSAVTKAIWKTRLVK